MGTDSDFGTVEWLSPEKYASMPVHERALHWASQYAQKGVREVGRNDGFFVRLFLKAVGLGAGYAWCASFVYHCLIKAGADPKKLPSRWKAARVSEWVAWAKQNGRLSSVPVRGGLFYWLNANGTGHTGFVRSGKSWPVSFETIEGNTSGQPTGADKERDGDGVYYRTRTSAKFSMFPESGFIDLRGL